MSFDETIYTVIKTELEDLFPGGVYAHNLPENYAFQQPALVLQYKQSDSVSTLDGFANQEEYELILAILTKSTETNAQLSHTLKQRLEDYETQAIADITLLNDINEADYDEGYYVKALNFYVIYNP